jgi:hypothetical protein
MFTGMAVRIAQDLGLHTDTPFMNTSFRAARHPFTRPESVSDTDVTSQFDDVSGRLLFWSIFIMDASLSLGTGRTPTIRSSDVTVPVPTEEDMIIISQNEGQGTRIGHVFPHTIHMFVTYARIIEVLNCLKKNDPALSEADLAMLRDLQKDLITKYQTLPKTLAFHIGNYKEAVKSKQGGIYLVLHLYFHMILVFVLENRLKSLSQEARASVPSAEEATETRTDEELCKTAIKSIVDILTFADLIDDAGYIYTPFINQCFFVAACSFVKDIVLYSAPGNVSKRFNPSQSGQHSAVPPPPGSLSSLLSGQDVQSASSLLAVIANANYQFLRQALRNQAKYFAGVGWVDAVLDQKEKGLRESDIDLSIIGEKVSTYVRLKTLGKNACYTRQGSADPGIGMDSNMVCNYPSG